MARSGSGRITAPKNNLSDLLCLPEQDLLEFSVMLLHGTGDNTASEEHMMAGNQTSE